MKFAAIGIGLTFLMLLVISIGLLDENHPDPVVIVSDGLRLTPATDRPLYFPIFPDPVLDARPVVQVATFTASTTQLASAQPAVQTPLPHSISPKPESNEILEEVVKEEEDPDFTFSQPEPTVTEPESIEPEPKVEPAPTTPSTPSSPQPASVQWGVFTGETSGIREFESYVPYNPDFLAYFVHWGNQNGELPNFLQAEARDKGRTLVLFWEASDYLIGGTNQPAYSYRNILNGNFDDYFDDFYQQLDDYGGDVILIPFSELNGNWTPWSGTLNGNTPAEAVAAFRKVYRKFSPLSNVQIGLALNAASVPNTTENQLENYYPGSDFVDIVGLDGFNGLNGEWLSFDEIFGRPLERLSKYNKPVMIFSYASGEGPNKDEWLYDMYYQQLPKHPYVTGWVYFNQDKEMNWLIWSDQPALDVFNETVEQLNAS